MSKTLSRRSFLMVSSAGGALIIGATLPGLRGFSTVEAAGTFEPNIWVKISSDDSITVMVTQLEMGQGVMTSMPMLVAEELDADWTKIKTEWVPAD
ncbi:MAG TPA: molybdopterin cofactor-binding domain-containing protein, partial [Terriglobia bacterium]|nr:molybdopterin cofactor-binding domain-containing protein [Terriglobia bacterium]